MARSSGKSNGTSVEKHNGHVSLAREEYDALVAREESYIELSVSVAKTTNQLHDVMQTCNAQTRRMAEMLLTIEHLNRIGSLQGIFIEKLSASAESMASLQDLSEFWRQWTISIGNSLKSGKITQDEVAKYEPDLFRTWRNWVHSSGKRDRVLADAGTRMVRTEYERASTDEDVDGRALRQLIEENKRLKAREALLELEVDSLQSRAPNHPGQSSKTAR